MVFAALLLVFFHGPLTHGGLASDDLFIRFDVKKGELAHGGESLFQFYSWFMFAAKSLKQGLLPAWTPFAGAGQPFIAKQQCGVFYPLNLPFFLWPGPLTLLPMVFMRLMLAALFTFALARQLGARFWAAVVAGLAYMLSESVTHMCVHAYSASAAFIPCVLLLTEQYFSGSARRALRLLPFAVAVAILGGYMQICIRGFLMAGAYFIVRQAGRKELSWARRLKGLAAYVAFAAGGVALAAVHFLPSEEYFKWSYRKIWRTQPEFLPYVEHYARRLGADDAPLLIVGALGLALFLWAARRLALELGRRARGAAAAAAACGGLGLSVFLACYGAVGMSTFIWSQLFLQFTPWHQVDAGSLLPYMAFGFAVTTLLLLALLDAESPTPIRVLGWTWFVGLLLYYRTPLLNHAVYSLPVLNILRVYIPLEVDVARALLAGWGLERLLSVWLNGDLERRTRAIELALAAWAVLIGGYLGQSALRAPLVDALGLGQNPIMTERAPGSPATILDSGEQYVVPPARYEVRVAVDDVLGARAVRVGAAGDSSSVEAVADGRWGTRSIYRAALAGGGRPEATIDAPGGPFRLVSASVAHYYDMLESKPVRAGALAALLAATAALLAAGPQALLAAVLALAVPAVWTAGSRLSLTGWRTSASRAEVLPELPFVKALAADAEPFRIHSLDDHFFSPEISGAYGIEDFRTSDTIDVLNYTYFTRLQGLALGSSRPDLYAKLLGVANVKYMLAAPQAPAPAGGWEKIYQGEAAIYRNPYFLPRARLYEQTVYSPASEQKDWRSATQSLPRLLELVARGADPAVTLMLNDAPADDGVAPPGRDAASLAGPSLLSSSPDATVIKASPSRPAYLFLSRAHFPGWTVAVDGKPARLLRAWLCFMAVALPAGEHVVEFRYEPLGLRLGAALSFAALALFLGLWIAGYPWEAQAGGLSAAEILLMVPVLAGALYWGAWCAFFHAGPAVGARLGGVAILASLAGCLAVYVRRRVRITPPSLVS